MWWIRGCGACPSAFPFAPSPPCLLQMTFFPLQLALLFALSLGPLPEVHSFQYGRCFQKLERHSIDNFQPLTEIFRTTPTDCLEKCITHTGNGDELNDPGYCRSVVYDHLQHSCRLYDHDGTKVPSVVHPANGFDLFRRTSSMQECVGPFHRLLALNAKKGVFAAPNKEISASEGNSPIPIGAAGGDPEAALSDDELAFLLDQLEKKERNGGEANGPTGDQEGALIRVGGAALNEGSVGNNRGLSCSVAGRPTGFLSHTGARTEGAEEFMGWSQKDCAEFCANNAAPDGQSFACAGYAYSPGGSRCFLHSKLAPPVQQQDAALFPNAVYAEKWCVPEHRYGMCRESVHFQVREQIRLAPSCVPLSTIGQVSSLSECLHKCMQQQGCRTVSLHQESLQCLLYRQQPLPNLCVPSAQGWLLAENGCFPDDSRRTEPMGMVDSEDGEMAPSNNNNDNNGDDRRQEPFAARAFAAQPNRQICAGGALSELLLGKKRRK